MTRNDCFRQFQIRIANGLDREPGKRRAFVRNDIKLHRTEIAVLLAVTGMYFSSECLAAGYADYVCTIYPPECPKIAKSTSLEPVRLTLATGLKGLDPKADKRRVVSFDIPRAFIDWKPYLKEEPQSQFKIKAALPDLLPYALWKTFEHERASTGLGPDGARKLWSELHKNWLPMDLSITYQINYRQCVESKCFDDPTELGLDRDLARIYTKRKPANDKDFERYLPIDTPAKVYENEELLIPKSYKPKRLTYLICDAGKMPTYNWCKVSTMYDKNILLRYQFEVKFLTEFPVIDEKIRSFVGKLIVSDELLDK